MRVGECSHRPILEPCELEGHTYQLDPYVGCEHHCYYCYALNRAETDWTEEIRVHGDFLDRLRQELAPLERQSIYMGWNSDPYQPAEATYGHTREALTLLAEQGFSVCILTKSDLVTRDIALFARMPEPSIGFSIAFQDERVRQLFEGNAPPNERRIAGLRALKEAGLPTYVLICPVMPYITDVKGVTEAVAPYADTIYVYGVQMDAEDEPNWRNVRGILDKHFPELTDSYREIAFSPEHPYWAALRQELREFQRETGLDVRSEV
jgi:DNA repair photolyase